MLIIGALAAGWIIFSGILVLSVVVVGGRARLLEEEHDSRNQERL